MSINNHNKLEGIVMKLEEQIYHLEGKISKLKERFKKSETAMQHKIMQLEKDNFHLKSNIALIYRKLEWIESEVGMNLEKDIMCTSSSVEEHEPKTSDIINNGTPSGRKTSAANDDQRLLYDIPDDKQGLKINMGKKHNVNSFYFQ